MENIIDHYQKFENSQNKEFLTASLLGCATVSPRTPDVAISTPAWRRKPLVSQ